jgi:endoglucanase
MPGAPSLRPKPSSSRGVSLLLAFVFSIGIVTIVDAQPMSQPSGKQATTAGCRGVWSGHAADSLGCGEAVGVSGTHMTLNDRPWLSRGVVLQALVAPLSVLEKIEPEVVTAKNNYDVTELRAIRAFGADTIRFQVSQPALDPLNTLYDAQYVKQVIDGLKLARENGFIVVIMMQDEGISGETTPHPFAIAETLDDWEMLNSVFGKDRGVLYELYNEPKPAPTEANWNIWKNGGSTGADDAPSIGMQTMVSQLRGEGSENTFVLDGLAYAATLNGVPLVDDPFSRVVYAVHPYPHGSDDAAKWPAQFGDASETIPVYADEWSAQSGMPASGHPLGLGDLPTYQVAVDLLNYLRAHQIPLCAGAFDVPNFMVQDVPGWTPTNYDNYSTSIRTDDAGALVHILYRSHYRRPLTYADGVTH